MVCFKGFIADSLSVCKNYDIEPVFTVRSLPAGASMHKPLGCRYRHKGLPPMLSRPSQPDTTGGTIGFHVHVRN